MTLSDADLDAIEVRVNAATPGPWISDLDKFDDESIEACVASTDSTMLGTFDTETLDWDRAKQSQALRDAAFTAHAREDIPALLAEVRRLRK